ncbi:MAG TPA: prephenate dehydratase domain-containing protein [Longimicrobiales bacterium]|nr:prephenate dehydratase domain-containing protein [Longimicrobiales bacterium]
MKTVAFQGEPGAFSEEAAIALCGPECALLPCRTFQAVAEAVLSKKADCGVLPMENSIIGPIHSSVEVLEQNGLKAEQAIEMPIHHYLLGVKGAEIGKLKKVISHPAALAQCELFFEKYPFVKMEEHYDTAGAARDVSKLKDPLVAAIASRRAGLRYKLEVLQTDIEDSPDNRTRFIVVTR